MDALKRDFEKKNKNDNSQKSIDKGIGKRPMRPINKHKGLLMHNKIKRA